MSTDTSLPLDAYALSPADAAELKQSYLVLLQKCAEGFGATAQIQIPETEQLEDDSRMWGGRFGTLTMDHASSLGYHAGPNDPVVPGFGLFANDGTEPLNTVLHGPEASVLDADDDSKPTRIQGLPKGGCVGQVSDRLGGDPLALSSREVDQMRLKAFRDKRTTAAIAKWSSCMAESGFTFKTIDAPFDKYGDGSPVSAEEIAVAKADVTCTRTSRWRDVSFAIEKAYQERAVREDPERWDGLRRRAQTVLAKAKRLVVS